MTHQTTYIEPPKQQAEVKRIAKRECELQSVKLLIAAIRQGLKELERRITRLDRGN